MKASLLLLLLVALSVKSECSLINSYRKRNPPDPFTVFRLADVAGFTVVGLHAFRPPETVDLELDGHATDDDVVGRLPGRLEAAGREFAETLRAHVDRTLASYCRTLRRLMVVESGRRKAAAIERAALGESDLCAVSFLFHLDVDVDAAFRVAHALRRPSDDGEYLSRELDVYLENRGTADDDDDDDGDEPPAADLLAESSRIKRHISLVSKIFCLQSVGQIVMKDVHFDETFAPKHNSFLSYADVSEKIIVRFRSIGGHDVIESWDVSYVSTSPEFNVANYMEKLEVPRKISVSRLGEPEGVKNDKWRVNLETLRARLSSGDADGHYLNRVMYSNILLEVLLLAAVKEGNKTLQVAMDLTSGLCGGGGKKRRAASTAAAFDAVRGKLKGLIYTFGELAKRIRRLVCLDEHATTATNSFESNARTFYDAFTRLNSIPPYSYSIKRVLCADDYARLIENSGLPVALSSDAVFGDINSKRYYLIDPLENVKSLLDVVDSLF